MAISAVSVRRGVVLPAPRVDGEDGWSVYGGAELSGDGAYRYTLARLWGLSRTKLVFVMLNPSTADALKDDPTIRRLYGFARSWGFDGFSVVNLFAYRATKPADLRAAADPVGPLNDGVILKETRFAEVVVAAWGNGGEYLHRDRQVMRAFEESGRRVFCLGMTASGQPLHPLYVRGKEADGSPRGLVSYPWRVGV